MKKLYSIIMTAVLLSQTLLVVSAEDESLEPDVDSHGTGLAEMTQEEWDSFNAKLPRIVDIKPNEIAVSRLEQSSEVELYANTSSSYEVSDLGQEMSYAIPGNPSSGGAAPSEFPLSSFVDVSESLTFPPIGNQGSMESCVAWSLGYYQLTNNNCVVKGLNAKTASGRPVNENIMTPRFIYTLINGGRNVPTHYNEACAAIMSYGCPSIEDYSADISMDNVSEWCIDTGIWNSAIYNKPQKITYGRIDNQGVVDSETDGVVQIKKILSNGYVVTVPTFVNSFNYTRGTSSGEYGCRYMSNDKAGGHAMTIVGYDDRFWVDVNNNRTKDNGEIGAFKVANSWGTDAKDYSDGYVWIPYDALGDVSDVRNAPVNRKGIFDYYYYIEPQKEYTPLLVAEVEIATKHRNQVAVKIGVSDGNSSSPEQKISVVDRNIAFNNASEGNVYVKDNKVPYNKNFTDTTSNQKVRIPFDLTPVIKKVYGDTGLDKDTDLKLYVEVADCVNNGSPVTLGNVTIVEPMTGNFVECENKEMLEADNDSVMKAVDFKIAPFVGYDGLQDITLIFNSDIQTDSLARNIYLKGPGGEIVYPEYDAYDNRIVIYPPDNINGYIDDTKYELYIKSGVKSLGGNHLSEDSRVLIYILDEYYAY